MKTLSQIEEAIKRKENLIKLLQDEIVELTLKLTKNKPSKNEGQSLSPIEN